MKTFSPTIILPAALALLISSSSTADAQIRHRNRILRGTQSKQKRRAKSTKKSVEEVAGIEEIAGGFEPTDMSAPMSISFMSPPSIEIEEVEDEEKPKPKPPKPPSKKDAIESSSVTEEEDIIESSSVTEEEETETVVAPLSNTESSSVMQSTSGACIVGSLVAGALFMMW